VICNDQNSEHIILRQLEDEEGNHVHEYEEDFAVHTDCHSVSETVQ
jgi:hypothetical protein